MATSTINDKIDNALRLLASAPGVRNRGQLAYEIKSALVLSKMRIEHLEGQLAATETMRDRIAMQLLPGLQERAVINGSPNTLEQRIAQAYEQADKVLAFRAQGSAEAPGETTTSNFREFEIGDTFTLHGRTATIDGVDASARGLRRYSWSYADGGSEGGFTADEIATLRLEHGDA